MGWGFEHRQASWHSLTRSGEEWAPMQGGILPFFTIPSTFSFENIMQGHLYHKEEIKKQINMGEEEMENKTPTGAWLLMCLHYSYTRIDLVLSLLPKRNQK